MSKIDVICTFEVLFISLSHLCMHMKSFIAKRVISILVNLRYLRFKLLKFKENKKICNTFDHNFKNIPLYIMSNVSLERYYFVLYDGSLTLKMSKMALNAFCDKTLHIYHHFRARRVLMLFKDVWLRTRRALLLYKVYCDITFLVLKVIAV